MGVFHQLKGMLKSQFIIMRRNKCLSIVELFCPVFLLLLFFLLRLLFVPHERKYFDDIDFLSHFSTNLTYKITSKSQNSFNEINENSPLPYTYFLAQCKNAKLIAIIGKDFPDTLIKKISSYFWELEEKINEVEFFKKFETVEEFDNYISSKNYGKNDENPKICFGISKVDKFKFGIHYNTINVENKNITGIEKLLMNESPHIPDSKANKNEQIRTQENLNFFEYYKTSGYLMVMKLIYDYILEEITGNPEAHIDFSVIGMIFDHIKMDDFHNYLYLIGFFIIISYSIIFSLNIYREIHFRETKKKEYIKSMGVKERIFFLSSFIRSFIINLIHSLLGSLMIKLVLVHSQYKYLFTILFLFGLVIFSMTYFFQSFLQGSRKGVILSLLCFCIMSFLYLPINSPEINKFIVYAFCILFPPSNLILGLNVLYIFEKEFYFFNNNIKLDVSLITIFQMLIFFVFSFFLYLILGYTVSQIFCYEYGINKCSRCIKRKRYINDDNLNNINNNQFKSNEDLISRHSDKNSNIDNNNLSNFGQAYIESDEKDIKQHKPEIIQKQLKIMAYDLMNTPIETNAYSKKKEQFENKLKEFESKKTILPDKDKIDEDNNFIKDELENFDNKREVCEIRNKRKEGMITMCNLKSDEYFINNNLNLSEIKYPGDESFMSKSIEGMISEESDLNETRLKDDEFNLTINNINPGARLEINNLTKSYKNSENILDGLSCKIYENEIFALLGENGAGKSTFISILSGLIESTGGSIRYKIDKQDIGAEITTPAGIVRFRKILGVCPQNNNILFDQLTVKENLEVFCLLKYDKEKNKDKSVNKYIEEEVEDLLKKFDLKAHVLAKDLSGGQKRKLSIAIACCGRSKVIILDEPTGGIDISSRRNIWNILKKIKLEDKMILLITHFMDEASFLADKIGILKKGRIVLNDTNRNLIDKYGKYISIKINKKLDYKKANDIVKFINNNYIKSNRNRKDLIKDDSKTINDTQNTSSLSKESRSSNNRSYSSNFNKLIYLETYRERIIIRIPTKDFDFSNAHNLLKDLEEKFEIKSYSIVKDQLEDVFINTINSKNGENKKEDMFLLRTNQNIVIYRGFEKFKNDLKISFLKRLKDYKTIISEIIFPVFLTLIACLVSYVEWLEENKTNSIELNNFSNDSQIVFYESTNTSEFLNYQYLLYTPEASEQKEKLKNYEFKYLPNKGYNKTNGLLKNIISYLHVINIYSNQQNITNNYANYYLIGANKETHQYEFITIISTKRRHSPIAFTNYLLSNIIKYEIDEINKNNNVYKYSDIGIINSPFRLTYEEKNDKKSRNGFVLVFFISIALSLIPSNFITTIIREKENKSKHLQILSGLSLLVYWINNYIFEIIKYFLISLLSLIILRCFNFYDNYLIGLYTLYGPALISFTYFISCFIEKEGTGQTLSLVINLLFGSLGGSAILILRTNNDTKILGEILSYFFRLVPSFCICYGYNEILSKKLLYSIDYYREDFKENELKSFIEKYNKGKYIIDYIKFDFIYLSIEIVIYTFLLFFFENKDYLLWKYFCKRKKRRIKEQRNKIDYNEKIKYINDAPPTSSKGDIAKSVRKDKIYPLEVSNLKKYYIKNKTRFLNFFCKKDLHLAIDDLSFKVENGECFGFIGANGAGKTSTFKCLCKEIKPTEGYVKINQIDIFDYSIKEKPSIGYCPQFDSVFEHLTVKENLYFYGELKGINEKDLDGIVNIIMKKLDLNKFQDTACKNLSGGNKRKLSVGISIMCYPNVIFMDEPSTGMDPYTRRLLLDLLNKVYLNNQYSQYKSEVEKQRAIILTTHSIEEVEALCDKIGILVNGRIGENGMGNIIEVVQKNSKGIELNVEFKTAEKKELKEKYGNILYENVKGEQEIKNFLISIKRKNYINYMKIDSLGRDLLNFINNSNNPNHVINKFSILIWVTYLDYLINLVNKIKNYFVTCEVKCIKFKLNNFILHINNQDKENKCDSYIFGLLEGNKKELKIVEYSYTLTTLESVFLEFCDQSYHLDKQGEEIFKNEEQKENLISIML